ncbi:dTDP-4-dehydrorhamnose reductase [Mariniflexile litorale]|uniref:dTDP-4-dehydrorhamnose reductase n=1 Tax=Mariniflexile litorale TaxID=3045158 RepID=A0AAU7EJR2_9FLAO|nr:dTDP-4-dehydrorhamnose reductase [Mariniflexile sp. KMM 9835]MDQ8211327.1 dTDP-4-dehydrorhamnose reductase [Mariniflexile sp. KMM 9835]
MTTILVTGGNGQLASCIKDVEKQYDDLNVIYTDYLELDICDLNQVQTFFKTNNQINYCINCAAYTAVDKAEIEVDKAFEINATGAKNLALACNEFGVVLIHISTDFVFDGNKQKPYTETDKAHPVSVYGETKMKGEIEIASVLQKHFLIRTSWLYSEHGNNFMKTMLRLAKEKDSLNIVSDQIGTPTYAGDLAEFIFYIIKAKSQDFGTYHYSNFGEISWYDFANEIFKESKIDIKLTPIATKDYPTFASRPMYSVLDKSKILKKFNIEIPYWQDSLKKGLLRFNLIS